MLPEMDTPEWEKMVARMRFDLENNFALTRLEGEVREKFEKQGIDIDAEFKKMMEGEKIAI